MRARAATLFVACILMSPAQANEQADIQVVEEIIKVEKLALEIRNRARERAKIAVDKSSLGKKRAAVKKEYDKAVENFKQSKAYREHEGSEKMSAEDMPIHDMNKMQAWALEGNRRLKAYDKAREPVDKLAQAYSIIVEQCVRMQKEVFQIFLDNEISRAVEDKKNQLSRKLKKLKKKEMAI